MKRMLTFATTTRDLGKELARASGKLTEVCDLLLFMYFFQVGDRGEGAGYKCLCSGRLLSSRLIYPAFLFRSHSSTQAEARKLSALKDLLDGCLALDPTKRLTPDEVLKHPFIVDP
jgi:serine/threonine protein kinase